MNPLFEAAAEIQQFCASKGWQSAIIGGLAVQRWGEPRQTRDVDLALLTGLGREAMFIDTLLERYAARMQNAREFALDHRVLLIQSSNGVPVDLSLAALPFEERVVGRSSEYRFGREIVRTCSAEDLIVLKAFADRPQDWIDIEGVIVRQGAALNRTRVLEELLPLLELKEDFASEKTLRQLLEKHRRAST